MSNNYKIRDLVRDLSEDEWRKSHPFSDETNAVHRVLFHPFATDDDKQDALASWFQRYQPCLFGRIAAATNAIHYIFLSDEDLRSSDAHISQRIREGRIAWWRRSVSPRQGHSSAAHGFVLVLASERIALAEPNITLQTLANEVLRLWNCEVSREPQGTVHWEHVYLEDPTSDQSYVKFTFSVDFFAVAGDGRWWQDHRMPGGIGFTANSVGHMSRYREWYEGKSDQNEWALRTAMETISYAAETPFGKATWLRPLIDNQPFVLGKACPIKNQKATLAEFDWTKYAGHLHTDHSVRPEFFRSSPDKPSETKRTEWVQDFLYLFDPSSPDYARFVSGQRIAEQEVVAEIGRREDYVKIASPRRQRPRREGEASFAGQDGHQEVEDLLAICRKWRLAAKDIDKLRS